ncbi:lytic transglycosylase domain-containing protein [Rhodobacter sp. Har01]|uniref:lytic transglycosylase domain-containing protein n=1 Tax=Rhodobacter sp. Har01 TaxID=2883999 RepID=UPI00222148A1|nr:lytic transglycosylase domain-containing protein [Rhodobacter sp. Har01]
MRAPLRLLSLLVVLIAPLARAETAGPMQSALALAASGDWEGALRVAPPGLGRDVVVWQALRAGEGRLGDYETFLARHPDWPGLLLLREKGEAAAARSDTPERVVAYFGEASPETGAGAVALVRSLKATGAVSRAETEAMRAWAELDLTAEQEDALLGLVPEALAGLHELRLDNLLWAGQGAQVERMLPLVSEDWRKLARARVALRAEAKGVDTLVAAVPEALKSHPGLTYERFVFRMRKDRYDEAAELILATPPEALGRPEMWAERRALLARWLMRQGRAAEAYKVAARHGLSEGTAYADLEFLAGFVALRKLGDGEAALRHFGHLGAEVTTPISLARAAYWQGRALEALGQDADAEVAYRAAARHQTAYYGLLAAERLGLPLDASIVAAAPAAGDWQSSAFASASALEAGRLLLAAGDRTLGKRFLLHLAESLDDTELAQLAEMALEMGEPHVALVIAKSAAERGLILPRAYYPVPDFVPDGLKVSRALALAISRRESEFDPAARSKADARGLMQVLPGTAKLVAGELGIDYAPGKLLTDPAYNVTIGSAYLAHMVEAFGPSVALIASGYNAGPNRPRRWIGEFGDPRNPEVDVVDWVETIPFAETRTYVMRVAEGVVIYRAKLKGVAGPVRISAELRG